MADLMNALERLTRAVQRLESAAAGHLPQCNEDRRQLADALLAAQTELTRLGDMNESAVDRLDGAIDTIRSTLRGGLTLMAQVEITVNGRGYVVACDAGQEAHVTRLSKYLDQKVATLVSSFGQVGDARLAVMAGLIIADELADSDLALNELRTAEALPTPERPSADRTAVDRAAGERVIVDYAEPPQSANEAVLAQALDTLAQRIEEIAAALEQG